FNRSRHHPHLHSSPTRRSSDLPEQLEEGLQQAGPARVDGPRACRVLVVDDDPIVAAGTAAMLEDLGHRAIEAGSAEIALQLLSSDRKSTRLNSSHVAISYAVFC